MEEREREIGELGWSSHTCIADGKVCHAVFCSDGPQLKPLEAALDSRVPLAGGLDNISHSLQQYVTVYMFGHL